MSRMFLATSIWNAAARGTFLWSSFIGTAIVARLLPPETYGVYALLSVLITYAVVVCEAGLSSGLLRFATHRPSEARSQVGLLLSSVALQVAIAVCLAAVVLFSKSLLERAYGVTLGPYLLIGILIALLTVLKLDLQNLRIVAGRGGAMVGANLAFTSVWIGGLLLFSRTTATLFQILVLQASATALLTGWLLLRSRQGSRLKTGGRTAWIGFPTGMLVFSLAFMGRGVVNQVVMRQTEVFFIGRYWTMQDVAYYDIGYSFAFFALMSIHQAIYPVAIASLSRVAQNGIAKLQGGVQMFYKVIFIHVVPISVVGMILGDKLVELVYGAQMAPAGQIAQVFFGINTLFFLTAGLVVGMYALGKPWVGFRIAVIQAILNIALDLLLIPRLGVLGAVLAVLGTLLLVTPIFLRVYAAELGEGLVPWSYLVRCGAAASLMLLLLPLREHADRPWSVLVLLGAAGLIYLLGIRLFGLIGESEKHLLERSGLRWANSAATVLGARKSKVM